MIELRRELKRMNALEEDKAVATARIMDLIKDSDAANATMDK